MKTARRLAMVAVLVVLGLPGGAAAQDIEFGEATPDGRRVFFETKLSLVPADRERSRFPDVYQWRRGGLRLVSVAATRRNFRAPAQFLDASRAGSTALFQTYSALIPPDSRPGSADYDIYRWRSGGITHESTGPTANTCADCFGTDSGFLGASPALSSVLFSTGDRMTAVDTDNESDIYLRSGGSTSLLTVGPSGGNGDFRLDSEGAAGNGRVAFFSTAESLVPSDTVPDSYDLYRATSGGVDRIGDEQFFHQSSFDGSRAIFEHTARLVPADTDSKYDVYEWTGAGGIRLLSKGSGGRGNGPFGTRWRDQSADAREVLFYSDERLVTEDIDSFRDIYVAARGSVKLVSTGPRGGNGSFEAVEGGISADGRFAFFMTKERLVRSDRDSASDLYRRGLGRTTRISRRGGRFEAASPDGDAVLFIAGQPQARGDRDDTFDLYRWQGGRVKLLSRGPAGGNGRGNFDYVTFAGATPNARHAYFLTRESLVRADRDRSDDLYSHTRGQVVLLTRPAR